MTDLTPWTNLELRETHPEAAYVADYEAGRLRCLLETCTPVQLGFGVNVTADEAVASRWLKHFERAAQRAA
jgi:hypothetical protein